jgi:hypothetical protein
MLEQAGGLRGNIPVLGIGQSPPGVNVAAYLVDDGGGIVHLLFGGKPQAFVEYQTALYGLGLSARIFPLPGLGNGSDELRSAAAFDNMLGGLAVGIQFPMAFRVPIGRIEDWMIKKRLSHGGHDSTK